MIHKTSTLHVIDNSGASLLKCIHVCSRGKKAVAFPGMVLVVSVIRLRKSIPKKLVKRSKVCFALVTAISFPLHRFSGMTIRGFLNTAIILGKYNKKGFAKNKPGDVPLANCFSGSVYREVRSYGYLKVMALARGIV